MTEQNKTRIRIYLRDEALQIAAQQALRTGSNMSEAIEKLIITEAHNATEKTQNKR